MKTKTYLPLFPALALVLNCIRRFPSSLAAFVLAGLAIIPSQAETILWTNLTGGNWNVAANWEPNRVPAAGDEVVITNAGTYTVTLNANASPARLTLGGESGIQTLAIPGSTFTLQTEGWVTGNGVLALSGGTLTGSGVLTVSNVLDWTGGDDELGWGDGDCGGGDLEPQRGRAEDVEWAFGDELWDGGLERGGQNRYAERVGAVPE